MIPALLALALLTPQPPKPVATAPRTDDTAVKIDYRPGAETLKAAGGRP